MPCSTEIMSVYRGVDHGEGRGGPGPSNICSGWALLYSLSIQLQMFANKYKIPTLSEAHNVF